MKLEDWNPKPCSTERVEGYDVSISSTFSSDRVVIKVQRDNLYHGELNIGSVSVSIEAEQVFDKEQIKLFVEEIIDEFIDEFPLL